jgi:hypothetical protein
MGELVRFEGGDAAFMWVELPRRMERVQGSVAERGEVEVLVDPGDGVRRATTALENSLESVRGAALALMSSVSQIGAAAGDLALGEVSLELGLSVGVEGGVIVAKGSAEAHAAVTLTWKAATGR